MTEEEQQASEKKSPSLLERAYNLVKRQPALITTAVVTSGLIIAILSMRSPRFDKAVKGYWFDWWLMRLIMSAGWTGLGIDVFTEHYGVRFRDPAMYTPLVFIPIGVGLQTAALMKGEEGRPYAIASDMIAIPVGLYGQMRHVLPRLQPGLPLKGRVTAAHPPVLAPASFAALAILELLARGVANDHKQGILPFVRINKKA